ncbi:MAG: hypothetical protein HQM16_18700 [Deltaproteobacteria bacterium]|nr:hypothetical protein [Deltaproteobacteria bacterium]
MQTQLATRMDPQIKKAIDEVCKKLGIKLSKFIEDAVLDKLEEFLDTRDLAKLRKEPTRSFEAVIKDLESHGKI